MSDGIYINYRRPATKKAVKEAIASDPSTVQIEGTSIFGGYTGPVLRAPNGSYHFVGPDPYTSRKFYGTITVLNGKATVK
jgi:hypothetical protein